MSAKNLAAKYIESAESVFREVQLAKNEVKIGENKIEEIISWAKNYLEDAKYYEEKKKFGISLTSIAYCEGLLDALKLIGVVNFQWPSRRKTRKRTK